MKTHHERFDKPAQLLGRHPSLRALERRLRWRWLGDSARLGLLWALAGSAIVTAGGRLLALESWGSLALFWPVLALSLVVGWRMRSWPNLRAVALAADGLGLEERVASSLDAGRAGHPAAALVERDAARSLAGLRVDRYPLVPQPRAWRTVAALAGVVALLWAIPLPTIGERGRQADETQRVLASRRALERTSAELTRLPASDPLVAAAAAELRALDLELADATTAEAAARRIEAAQEQLAELGRAEEFAWRRALGAMAESWTNEPELQGLARAVAAHDERRVQQAAAELAARAEELDVAQLRRLSLGLQAGANAARDAPAVASALREIASHIRAVAGDDSAAAVASIGDMLAQGSGRAASLDAAQRAVAALGSARAALGTTAGTGSRGGATARGSTAGRDGAPAGSASGSAATSTAGRGGQGAGSGPGAGSGNPLGTGSAGRSGAAGSGPAGSGTGAGAGLGSGPAAGQPGAPSAGQTLGGGQGVSGPQEAVVYVPPAGPSLLGGPGGPEVAVAGEVSEATGQLVDLPESPLDLGALRPYRAVFGEYEESARQSLARQELPPALENLVQRYFSAISPVAGSEP